ncbi:MAG: hypothetical protein ABIP53_00395 [Candidatus Limnocylindrales bacterium]
MPDIVAEDPLQDGATGMDPRLVPLGPAELLVEHVEGPSVQAALDDAECGVQSLHELIGAEHVLEIVSPGQLLPAFVNRVVSAPRSPAKSQSQNTRWQAVWPTVAQIGHRSGAGVIASCSSVKAATTSRRRRLY